MRAHFRYVITTDLSPPLLGNAYASTSECRAIALLGEIREIALELTGISESAPSLSEIGSTASLIDLLAEQAAAKIGS